MSDSDDYEPVEYPPQPLPQTSASVGGDYAPPVPSSPRPVLFGTQSGSQTPPPGRRVSAKNTGEATQLMKSLSLDDGRLARVRLSSPSKDEVESMNLGELVSRHGGSLPLHVRVENGYCGGELRNVISAGDEYIIHFVNQRKVVTLSDSNSCQYTIPTNSPIHVAPLYNPNDNIGEALTGFTFDSAADIASLHTLPKLVRATKSFRGGDSKCSVEEGELLVVKKVSRSPMKRKPVLKVFSITANEDKNLNEDCAGQFTTNPNEARVLVMQAVQQIPDPFPMEAQLYMRDVSPKLPAHLSSKVVTLTHSCIETFLVASTYCADNTSPSEDDDIPVEIPIQLDIDVSIVPSQETKTKQLPSNGQDLYKDATTSSESQPVAHVSNHGILQLDDIKKQRPDSEQKHVTKPRATSNPRLPPSPKLGRVSSAEKTSPLQQKPVTKPRAPQTPGLPPSPKLGRISSVEKTSPLQQKPVTKPRASSNPRPPPSPKLGRISSVEKTSPLQPKLVPTAQQTPGPPPLPTSGKIFSVETTTPTDSKQQLSVLQSSTKSLKTTVDALQANSDKQFSSIKADLARMAPIVDNLSKQCSSVKEKLEQLKRVVVTLEQKQPRAEPKAHKSSKERNNMRSLTHIQVSNCTANEALCVQHFYIHNFYRVLTTHA